MIRSLRSLGSVVAALTLASSASQVHAAGDDVARFIQEGKANLELRLKDPASAIYRGLYVSEYTDEQYGRLLYLCGEVNAKNSFGAYNGFRPFYSAPRVPQLVWIVDFQYPDLDRHAMRRCDRKVPGSFKWDPRSEN